MLVKHGTSHDGSDGNQDFSFFTSLFLFWLLTFLLFFWLLLTQLRDINLLLAFHYSLGEQLKHVVQVGVDLRIDIS